VKKKPQYPTESLEGNIAKYIGSTINHFRSAVDAIKDIIEDEEEDITKDKCIIKDNDIISGRITKWDIIIDDIARATVDEESIVTIRQGWYFHCEQVQRNDIKK
jgi:hypothetical protein